MDVTAAGKIDGALYVASPLVATLPAMIRLDSRRRRSDAISIVRGLIIIGRGSQLQNTPDSKDFSFVIFARERLMVNGQQTLLYLVLDN